MSDKGEPGCSSFKTRRDKEGTDPIDSMSIVMKELKKINVLT